MSAEDVRFKVTHKKTGESAILSLADLFGYEGEVCGICICYDWHENGGGYPDKSHINPKLRGDCISFNSGYGYEGMNPDFEIEPVKEE